MTVLTWARVPLVLMAALVLQVALVGDLRIGGATGDLVVVLAMACAMVAGAQVGSIVAFGAGVLVDLTLTTPFGLTPLSYCLVAYVVGRLLTDAVHPVWWTAPVTLGVASAGQVGVYALAAAVVGRDDLLGADTLTAMAVVGGLAAVLAPVAARVARWTMRAALEGRP